MKIDIMDDRNVWIEVIHLLHLDQALGTPTTFEWELSDELFIAARFLKTLSSRELTTFCIGEQTDMDNIIAIAQDKEGAEAAHRILDALFNHICGVEEPDQPKEPDHWPNDALPFGPEVEDGKE